MPVIVALLCCILATLCSGTQADLSGDSARPRHYQVLCSPSSNSYQVLIASTVRDARSHCLKTFNDVQFDVQVTDEKTSESLCHGRARASGDGELNVVAHVIKNKVVPEKGSFTVRVEICAAGLECANQLIEIHGVDGQLTIESDKQKTLAARESSSNESFSVSIDWCLMSSEDHVSALESKKNEKRWDDIMDWMKRKTEDSLSLHSQSMKSLDQHNLLSGAEISSPNKAAGDSTNFPGENSSSRSRLKNDAQGMSVVPDSPPLKTTNQSEAQDEKPLNNPLDRIKRSPGRAKSFPMTARKRFIRERQEEKKSWDDSVMGWMKRNKLQDWNESRVQKQRKPYHDDSMFKKNGWDDSVMGWIKRAPSSKRDWEDVGMAWMKKRDWDDSVMGWMKRERDPQRDFNDENDELNSGEKREWDDSVMSWMKRDKVHPKHLHQGHLSKHSEHAPEERVSHHQHDVTSRFDPL